MKKVLVFACVLSIGFSSLANEPNNPNVSDKALKAFETTFTGADNVNWSNTGKLYSVSFIQNGINTTVKYDEQGNFINSRRYYSGTKLPIDIQNSLKKEFSDKSVFGVTEITIGQDVHYFIMLENKTTWTSIRINNARDIEVTDTYTKL